MPKLEERVVKSLPLASPTSCEGATALEPYVWDSNDRPRQDPFFAVQSIVMELPRQTLTADDKSTVSITF